MKILRNTILGIVVVIVLGIGLWRWQIHMVKQFLHDELYAGPVKTFVAGRFMFELPVNFSVTYSRFEVRPYKGDTPYWTERIAIEEIPWKSDDHSNEFAAFIDECVEESVMAENWSGNDSTVVKRDLANSFAGNTAILVADLPSGAMAIKTFVSLPQGIIYFKETRTGHNQMFIDLEKPAAKAFQHYHWGKIQRPHSDVF